MKDPYEISVALELLGCKGSQNLQEVKVSYKKLATKYHPDNNKNSEEEFKDLTKAFSLVEDYVHEGGSLALAANAKKPQAPVQPQRRPDPPQRQINLTPSYEVRDSIRGNPPIPGDYYVWKLYESETIKNNHNVGLGLNTTSKVGKLGSGIFLHVPMDMNKAREIFQRVVSEVGFELLPQPYPILPALPPPLPLQRRVRALPYVPRNNQNFPPLPPGPAHF